MTCPACRAEVGRIVRHEDGRWGCPVCDRQRNEPAAWIREVVSVQPGFGAVTRGQLNEWLDRGAFIERTVTGKGPAQTVHTVPLTRRQGTRRHYWMGGKA